MSKGSRIKENNNFFEAFVFYECFIGVGHRSKECRSKKNNEIFGQLSELSNTYCRTVIRVSDTATRLLLEVSVLHI
jgi:hypothetical protein